MILRFPYPPEPLRSPPPPALPVATRSLWRPLVPLTVQSPGGGAVIFGRALLDPGADDTVLPLETAELLSVKFYPLTNHFLRWRGQHYPLQYGQVTLELADEEGNVLAWPAVAAFTIAAIRYPLLEIRAASSSSMHPSAALNGFSNFSLMRPSHTPSGRTFHPSSLE